MFFSFGSTLDNRHDGHKPELSIITAFERFFLMLYISQTIRWCIKRLIAKLTIPYRDETP